MDKRDDIIELLGKKGKRHLEVVKAFEEVPEEYQILLIEHLDDRLMLNIEIIDYYQKKGYKVVYITANNPALELIENLKKRNVDVQKLKIMDLITVSSEGTQTKEIPVSYLTTPRALIDLNELIENELRAENGRKVIIIDSITSLVVYNELKTVEKFIHTIIARLRKSKVKGILIASEHTNKEIIASASQFCDEVINI